MNLSNAAHLYLTINNPLILGDLIQRLMENTKDCKDISVTPTCQLSHRLLHIRIDGQHPTQTLTACGIKLCEIYGTTLILVEEGLSGKYHIYPIDIHHIPSNVSLVNLSLESMGNLKFSKDSRVRYEQITNSIREKSLLPRDAEGNVLDVHLEESKVLPKVDGESKAIRITDDNQIYTI